jgi:cell division septum initiation protein DivIVA
VQPWQTNQQAQQTSQRLSQQAQQTSQRMFDLAGRNAQRSHDLQRQSFQRMTWQARRRSSSHGIGYRAAATLVKLAFLAGVLYAGYAIFQHWR